MLTNVDYRADLVFPVVLGAYYGPATRPTMWGVTYTARNPQEYEAGLRMLENSYPGAHIVRKLPNQLPK